MRKLSTPSIYWGPALVKHRRLVNYAPDFVTDPEGKEDIQFSDIKASTLCSNFYYIVKGLGQSKAISFASNLLYQPELKTKNKISE